MNSYGLMVDHMNNKRHKAYTLKKTLTKFEELEEESTKATEESDGDESVTTPSVGRATRARIAPRAPPSTDVPASEKICTVCGNAKQKGDRRSSGFVKIFAQKSYLRQQYSFRRKYTIGQVTCNMFTPCLCVRSMLSQKLHPQLSYQV